MNAVHKLSLALAVLCATQGHAGYLPDPEAAEAALWASPSVAQARGAHAAQLLKSRSLVLGREEWNVGADLAQRRIQPAPGDVQAEWGLAVSRPLRLPARAAADRELANALNAHAEASLGEALHESGRQLLALWFDWLNAAGQVRLWQAQIAVAERQLATVNARIRLGEAPGAERVNAEAVLAQAHLQQQQAALREQQAHSRLRAQFPELPLTADAVLPHPAQPEGTAEAYVDAVLEHNHELIRARREAEVLEAEARKYARHRGVDPAFGVFYRNEAGGDEHVLGVSVGLTLPGAARRTDQEAAERLAAVAHDAVVRLERRLRADARADFQTAAAQTENWRQAERASQALVESARLSARAYELGEGSLDQVLLSRRLALESQLITQQAQLDALSAHARLQLDSHRLWPLDVAADSEHAHP